MKPDFEQTDRNRLLLVAILSAGVLWCGNYFFPSQQKPLRQPQQIETVEKKETPIVSTVVQPESEGVQAITEPKQPEQHIIVQNDALSATLSVQSGQMNDARLLKYKETLDKNSPSVTLLSDTYYTQTRWNSPDTKIPTLVASQDYATLLPTNSIIVSGQNESLKWERKLSVDDNYLTTTTDTFVNLTDKPIRLTFTGEVVRQLDKLPATSVVHEGFIAVLKDRLIEEKYTDIKDESFSDKAKGGWLGFTDKYWQTALILDEKEQGTVQFEHQEPNLYKATFTGKEITIPAGASYTRTGHVFTGAKDIKLLTKYENEYNIPKFDLTIDFGWFYIFTKPFLYLLNFLYDILGNMGIAILVFATLIRLLLLPIATKSYASMANMRKLQPKMQQLQERYKDDRSRLQIEMMNLYKREKVNPASGCLPLFLQIPIFYALYKVLSVSINMRQAPFYGWINDLSMPDPSSVFTAFGYLEWPIPAFLNLGVLPILMGLTMYIQQKLNPAPADPTQAKMMKWFPIVFTFMLGGFAAGLVLYWTWSNILSIAQQKYIMKKVGVK